MTLYYMSSFFTKMMLDYMETGKDTYFEMVITNLMQTIFVMNLINISKEPIVK